MHKDANVEMASAVVVAVTTLEVLDCHLLSLLLVGLHNLILCLSEMKKDYTPFVLSIFFKITATFFLTERFYVNYDTAKP